MVVHLEAANPIRDTTTSKSRNIKTHTAILSDWIIPWLFGHNPDAIKVR